MARPFENGTEKLRIFLGSSTERKPEATAIATVMESMGCEVLRWWQPGLIPTGHFLFPTLQAIAQGVDAAILIFANDDEVWFRDKKYGTPRDNVLIEFGLFSGIIGQVECERVIICEIGSPKIAVDLLGITTLQYDPDNSSDFVPYLQAWVDKLAARKPQEMAKRATIHVATQRRALFLAGEKIVQNAKKNLVLCARTPVPIVGPRSYDSTEDATDHERTQFDAYERALASLEDDPEKKIMLVGCLAALRESTYKGGPAFQARIAERLRHIYASSDRYKNRLKLRWIREGHVTTFLAADNDAIIWFKNSEGENIWIEGVNEELVKALTQNALDASKEFTLDYVLNELDL